jgi:hypothetical protein
VAPKHFAHDGTHAIAAASLGSGARIEALASDRVELETWEKSVFLAALAGLTCLTRRGGHRPIGRLDVAGGSTDR